MSNQIKTSAAAKMLYSVLIEDKYGIKEVVRMTDEGLISVAKYPQWYGTILIKEAVGNQWPEGATVEMVSSSTPFRCCSKVIYAVKSPRELTDFDKETLRLQGCFMSGQEYGIFSEPKKIADGYEYSVYSFCDSGD